MKQPYLLDVNMLIALAWPSHIYHKQAHEWFGQKKAHPWATCPLTQCAFVRLSSNPKIIEDAVLPQQALNLLKEMIGHKKHIFWPDDINWADSKNVPVELLFGHQQVTDAYLLGLVLKNKGKLATMDQKMKFLLKSPERAEQVLEIVDIK